MGRKQNLGLVDRMARELINDFKLSLSRTAQERLVLHDIYGDAPRPRNRSCNFADLRFVRGVMMSKMEKLRPETVGLILHAASRVGQPGTSIFQIGTDADKLNPKASAWDCVCDMAGIVIMARAWDLLNKDLLERTAAAIGERTET